MDFKLYKSVREDMKLEGKIRNWLDFSDLNTPSRCSW